MEHPIKTTSLLNGTNAEKEEYWQKGSWFRLWTPEKLIVIIGATYDSAKCRVLNQGVPAFWPFVLQRMSTY